MWAVLLMAVRELVLLNLDLGFCERFSMLDSYRYLGYSFPGISNGPLGSHSEPFSLVHL